MKNKLYNINLIKDRKQNFFDKFLEWALTAGRLIIILTEVIALGTFLYRFSLDRELIDLHDKINQNQAFVKYLKTNEDKYRDLQSRLGIMSGLIENNSNINKIFSDIVSFAPEDFTFKNLLITESTVKIDGSAKSVASLSSFIKSLKGYPRTDWISLDKIENRTSSSTIIFSLTINFSKQKK